LVVGWVEDLGEELELALVLGWELAKEEELVVKLVERLDRVWAQRLVAWSGLL
jgi:hypothetical protein